MQKLDKREMILIISTFAYAFCRFAACFKGKEIKAKTIICIAEW